MIPSSSSSAHIYTHLLAADAVSACLSNSTRMSSMQSVPLDASAHRLAPARTGSLPTPIPPPPPPPPPPPASAPRPSRQTRSLSSDPGGARPDRPDGAAPFAQLAEGMPTVGLGRRTSDDMIAFEAAAAAAALRVHLRGDRPRRGAPRHVRSLPIYTTTNAIYEPERGSAPEPVSPRSSIEQHPDLPPADLLQRHLQDSRGSRESWAATRYMPETSMAAPEPTATQAAAAADRPLHQVQSRQRPRPRRHPTVEYGFPLAPPLAAVRVGESTESGATPCTASGIGDTSYDVTVQCTPPADASLRARLDFIEYQLDAFSAGSAVLWEYVMPGSGPGNRFKGGAWPNPLK